MIWIGDSSCLDFNLKMAQCVGVELIPVWITVFIHARLQVKVGGCPPVPEEMAEKANSFLALFHQDCSFGALSWWMKAPSSRLFCSPEGRNP